MLDRFLWKLAAGGAALSLSTGCAWDESVEHQITRGTTKVLERPVSGSTPHQVAINPTEQGVGVALAPAQCLTLRETPVTDHEITRRKPRWTNSLAWMGLGVGLGAVGVPVWRGADEDPEKCADGKDESCTTRSESQAAAITLWGLGAAAFGYGLYTLAAPGAHVKERTLQSVDRQTSAARLCDVERAGIPIGLRLPSGALLEAKTDPSGEAFVRIPDSAFQMLKRRARAAVLVSGVVAGEVPLELPVAAWQRRSGVEPGVLARSELVAASGTISGGALMLELALSPQDGAGEFVGDGLGADAFSFDDVRAVPVGGGGEVRLDLSVDRVDVAEPPKGGSAAILVFDSSGSMGSNDRDRSGRLEGARSFLAELQGAQEVAILDFGAGASDGLRSSRLLQSFTRDAAALDAALTKLREAGGTPLYESLGDSLSLLERGSKTGTIVLLTDGQSNRSRHEQTIDRAKQVGAVIYTVGLGRSLDFDSLRDLSLRTGGSFVEAEQTGDLQRAFRGVGVGVSVGRVRVFAHGRTKLKTPGPYQVRGTVVTRAGTKSALREFAFTSRASR